MSTIKTIPALPDFTLVTASAGSGKTTALTHRFLRLVMDDGLPHNDLRNILAVTFTKNAAQEMKERILETLKRAALGDEKALKKLRAIVQTDDDEIRNLAVLHIDAILDNYSDFQVLTIDSFITRVLKASSLELGLPPSFEVDFDGDAVLTEALDLFAREIASDPAKQELLAGLIDLLSEYRGVGARYLWNPLEFLATELRILYRQLSAQAGEPRIDDPGTRLQELADKVLSRVKAIGEVAKRPGLILSKRFTEIIDFAAGGDIDAVMGRTLSQQILNKPKGEYDRRAAERIGTLQTELLTLAGEYVSLHARTRYVPYLLAYRMIQHLIEQVKRRREAVFLGEASRTLARMLNAEVVPEIYFSLGEQIHHFLIDEFQDTSPIQWAVLRPLVEHSVGGRGSLFVVGDTKQSIYTFRGADWHIMRRMIERDEFPSVKTRKLPLTTNYRSAGVLVEFTKELFRTRVTAVIPTEISDLSGLASYEQQVTDEAIGKGYVEVHVIEPPATDEEKERRAVNQPEREHLLRILRDCNERGYGFRDMAILTPRNTDVVEVSRWLNEEKIPYLSYSSLDIRTRRTTGELLALLRFLDSPVDHLSFATFILGTLFEKTLQRADVKEIFHLFIHAAQWNGGRESSLYSAFRAQYPELWERYFERLFTLVGYLPLYDLAAEVYRAFDLFVVATEEEATLVKFLEVVKEFEENGSNSLKDFLRFAGEEGEATTERWEIPTAEHEDAVQVMTVHKAKGLGFPVLIALFYDKTTRVQSRQIVNEGNAVQLLYVTKEEADKSSELREQYDSVKALQQVDDLNKLYVALTRAREEMYLLCVKQRRGNQPSAFLPGDGYTKGTRTRKEQKKAPQERLTGKLHLHTSGVPGATTLDPIKLRETKRGEFIHNVLSDILFLDADVGNQVVSAIKARMNEIRETINTREISETVQNFLNLPSVAQYFTPRDGRTVLNEQEVVDRSGALHRIDRLVIDPDIVTVLDYKTGDEKDTYDEQVRDYMESVRTMYSGKVVKGFLLYVDRKTVREVR